MRFGREILTPLLCRELLPLLMKHYREIAHYQDIALDPDFDQYVKIEEMGCLRAYTARNEEGRLLGYAIFFVRSNIHYKGSLQAQQDVLFIDPAHRGGGARLIRFADQELAKEGVQVVYHHVKAQHNFGPLLERMGYRCVDLIYGRRLD